jgi:hypothetical protein
MLDPSQQSHDSLTSPRISAIGSESDQTPNRKMPFQFLFMPLFTVNLDSKQATKNTNPSEPTAARLHSAL